MSRAKKILLTFLVIIAIIITLCLICHLLIPFLFELFLDLLKEYVAPIIVLLAVIVCAFLAID